MFLTLDYNGRIDGADVFEYDIHQDSSNIVVLIVSVAKAVIIFRVSKLARENQTRNDPSQHPRKKGKNDRIKNCGW